MGGERCGQTKQFLFVDYVHYLFQAGRGIRDFEIEIRVKDLPHLAL